MFYLSKNIFQGGGYKYTFIPYLFHTRNYCFVIKLTSPYFWILSICISWLLITAFIEVLSISVNSFISTNLLIKGLKVRPG